MALDIKKVYVDTRFKLKDSLSNSDFWVELPRSLNVPDDCVCYTDDIVIPISWSTVDSRNNKFYLDIRITDTFHRYRVATLPSQNYPGDTLAGALQTALDAAVAEDLLNFEVSHDLNDNLINIRLVDLSGITVSFVFNDDLIAGVKWGAQLFKNRIQSLSGVLRIEKTFVLTDAQPYTAYIDLHTTRKLYLTTSSLASYNIISNFGNDVIVKKIPVKANYGQMLFDGAEAGFDYLDVSRRALQRFDFKLEDSFGNVLDLRGNHWSFSL